MGGSRGNKPLESSCAARIGHVGEEAGMDPSGGGKWLRVHGYCWFWWIGGWVERTSFESPSLDGR